MPDVSEQDTSHLSGEHFAPKVTRRHSRIDWVGVEKCHLFFHGRFDGDLILNILLSSILDTHKAQTQLNLLVHDHALGVRASVHDVDLGDDANGSDTLGINPARHPETLLRGHISVGSDDAKNDGSGVANISFSHAASNLLNVFWLAWDRHESDSWQVNQSEVWACVGVHVQHDRVVYNVGIGTADFVSETDDRVSHLLEVGELLASELLGELSPWLGAFRLMVETELKGASRDETVASGQEIETNNRLEH